MEKRMNYDLILSLQEIALRKVTVILWNESDVLASIAKFRFKSLDYNASHNIWLKSVECKVTNKMVKLRLPTSLSNKIIGLSKPIGLQIASWKMFHEAYLSEYLDLPILELLIWTSTGTIDYRKTAEVILRYDMIDVVKRYKLACLYCLDEYIPVFWQKLPQPIKMYFYDEDDFSQMEEPHLQNCWPYILKGELSKLDNMPGRLSLGKDTTFNQYAFEYSAFKGNKTAAEYFFHKLTDEERDTSLFRTVQGVLENRNNNRYKYHDDFPRDKLSDVLCYLLPFLSHEQQMAIFKDEPSSVLLCFLDWPWQDHFLDIAGIIWTFLPESMYDCLLFDIFTSIRNSGYYLPRLFQEFFRHSPPDFRKHFVNQECGYGNFFAEFFDVQDSETIKVVLRNVDAADRVRLVFCERVFSHLYDFVMRDQWDMVEMCIREATLSKGDKKRLKEAFMECLKTDKQIKQKTQILKTFFQFLDEKDASVCKRSLVDEKLTKAKKLCFEK